MDGIEIRFGRNRNDALEKKTQKVAAGTTEKATTENTISAGDNKSRSLTYRQKRRIFLGCTLYKRTEYPRYYL